MVLALSVLAVVPGWGWAAVLGRCFNTPDIAVPHNVAEDRIATFFFETALAINLPFAVRCLLAVRVAVTFLVASNADRCLMSRFQYLPKS